MKRVLWCSVVVLAGLLGFAFLLGGCGSESAKPKPGPQPKAPSPEPPSAKPLTPEVPTPPTPGPEKPTPPEEKTPQEKAKPQEKASTAPETTPSEGKEKPSAPETKPSEEKPSMPESKPSEEKQKPSAPETKPASTPKEPTPGSPPAEKAPSAGEASATDPVSRYAPAEDLVAPMEEYLKTLQEAVASEDAFKDAQGRLAEDANTLIVLALALGLHDQPNKYQKAAPALMAAAKELASAKDLASAKKAVDALAAAATAQADPSSLKWEKVAKMSELMKAVPLISNKIRDSSLTASRLEKRGKEYAGYAALLAVIAQGSLPNADETQKPTEVQKWQQFCLQMRTAAGELNAAIRAKNADAAKTANAKLRQTCDDCHAVFHTK